MVWVCFTLGISFAFLTKNTLVSLSAAWKKVRIRVDNTMKIAFKEVTMDTLRPEADDTHVSLVFGTVGRQPLLR